MPIGLTAKGDMVFPLQCRELMERQRGLNSSGAPDAASVGPKETGSGEMQTASTTKPAEFQAPVPASVDSEKFAKPSPPSSPERVGADVKATEKASDSEASASLDSPENNNGLTTVVTKPAHSIRDRVRHQRSNPEPQAPRSRLVTMTLRTIEYPDGHRQRRLLTINHARRVELQTEDQWYNPLGLR